MGHDLEAPFSDGKAAWASLYRARGEDVSDLRPVFTGDVFDDVPIPGSANATRRRTVMVVQHPCAMRTNGVDLAPKLLVAEVGNRKPLEEHEWLGNYSLVPLPDLRPDLKTNKRHQAANFDRLHMVDSADLAVRVASMSPTGVCLLLQRWVHFSSRVVVPTFQLHETIEGEYEEADLIEDWCIDRTIEAGVTAAAATAECVAWLRDQARDPTRQALLKEPQRRAGVRAEMRAELRLLRTRA